MWLLGRWESFGPMVESLEDKILFLRYQFITFKPLILCCKNKLWMFP